MKSSRPMRRRNGAKKLDLTDIREVLKDRRLWAGVAVTTAPDDGSQHWRIVTDPNVAGEVDILVHVVLEPYGIPVDARLAAGVWQIPDLGEEVAVMVPSGRIDFMPTIVALLSSNAVPSSGSGQGPSPQRIVIVRSQVLIHDGTGGAEELVKKSEFVGHTHGPGTFTNSSGNVTGTSDGADDITGTTVLKAK